MTQIKLRRDTAANFTSKNPVLGVGEPAYETDTKKLKIGDGTTAYTQLEYFSAGGGGSTDISATLPLKIVDGVISLEVDGQTIQIVDGKLHANLDDKQDKFETQVPLSISSASVSTSTVPSIIETEESWTGGGPNKLMTVRIQGLNIDANSDWKLHLSGYMGNYKSYSTNSTVVDIYTEDAQIFRIWFGSNYFRLGNNTTEFSQIPAQNSEFYYEIVHQKNDTKFTFNGTGLGSSDPLLISTMSQALGQAPYTTLAGKGKLKTIFFVIDSHLFQRIDKDISKSYIKADGVKYPITSVEGINTLKLGVGDGLSVVDGKLTASSTAPTNMVTTDTAQTITGEKTFQESITISNTGIGQIDKLRLAALNGSSTATTLYNGLQIYTDIKNYTSTLRVGDVNLPMMLQGSTIKDSNGNNFLKTKSLTQSEYDGLTTKDDTVLYVITD